MTDDTRPDPDALLAAITKEEAKQKRGHLKIFFGMAAGVGKTYAMLEGATERLAGGSDVAIGYVETHGRSETEELVVGLPIVPRRKLEYRGTWFDEMDLDAILTRHPQLVLVDELAHTNVPGARHPKRYQDVLELIDAGIDVYTTLNVQHLESRADTVRQITGATVRETVPDSILEMADEIELIDLAPEELQKRLAEGKVYLGDRAEAAAHNFFRTGNLTALREMALRLTAERVDHQLQDYMQVKQIAGPWKSGERLMVAISPSPLSERLARWTRRMAYNLDAPWLAVYVETQQPLSPEQQTQVAHNLDLARELGGEVVTTSGTDVINALLRVARQRNVTQIVVGKPPRNRLREILSGGPVVEKLIRHSGDIDVYVVTGDEVKTTEHTSLLPPVIIHSGVKQYFIALLVVGVVTGLNWLALPAIHYRAVALVYLFMVLLLGLTIGRGPVLLAATLSAFLWNFLFIPPQLTLQISALEDVLMFAMYFAAALATGHLMARLRGQEQAVLHREERSMALYLLTREVAKAVTMDDVLRTAVDQIGQVFEAQVAILLVNPNGHLAAQPHPISTLPLDEKERSVATWSFTNRKRAGRFTDTLALASAFYLPLLTPGGVVGVMGIRPREATLLSIDQVELLETFASQVALAIEREMLDEAASRSMMLIESERLYKTLLNSISHELRTPIATITGAASSLLDPNTGDQLETRNVLIGEIQSAADRLNRLVENLLDMTRLESGLLKIKQDWCDVSDLINIAVERMKPQLAKHEVLVDVAPNLPLVKMDFVLMEQALINLLHNAATYTPKGTRVRVSAKTDGPELLIVVADRGPGLPPESLDHVFDKFYRGPRAGTGGVGLGLSITRGLVEAHGGTISAENRINGGARFTIRLPLSTPPSAPQETSG
jgi:two-component system, OmpR family, sensor histidine kinase KdpD